MDKRIERTRREVAEAAIRLLGERGYSGFSMEAVAAAAGVSKSTIYRHWPDQVDLLADALEVLNRQPPAGPDHGSSRARVIELLRHLADAMTVSAVARAIPALIEAAERQPALAERLHAFSAGRRAALEQALRDGCETGAFPSSMDVRMTADALSGAIFYRRCMTPDPMRGDEVDALVATVLGQEK